VAAPNGRTDEPPALDPARYTITVHSPFQSLVKGRQLMNEIAVDVIAQLGYSESVATEGEGRTTRMQGVSEGRFFVRKSGGERRSIELDLIRNPAGAFDVVIYGRSRGASEETPNPDLPRLLPSVVKLFDVAETTVGQDHGPLGHFLFQLSYIQADQAIGMLKALGYSTVEFNKQPGATIWENLYEPVKRGETRLPYVIKFIEGSKMSIMEPTEPVPGAMPQMMSPMGMQQGRTTIPDIGGTFLHHMTAGEPEQRLLIVYDQEQPNAVQILMNMLREMIDVPARQVVISALVVELNTQRSKDLGITFTAGNGRNQSTFSRDTKDVQQPFTYTFDSSNPSKAFDFTATLSALITKGEAEILSNPSVLVLDGRQARIQIGQQVPVVNSTATAAGITSSVEYFPVGIVLNLRPRINEQGTDVTMQVETIVSAVGQNVATTSAVFFAPTIDNRQVQTFVRVANNTPFIIGGLISSNDTSERDGIPLLSQLPGVGALFRRTTQTRQKKEVIVVLTPHIMPADRPDYSYVLPKDSDLLDASGLRLFRNAYRIRSEDVHDLGFLDDSDVFQALLARIRSRAEAEPALRAREPFASLLAGSIPGEEILVRRMLWEIIEKLGIAKNVDPARIRLFEGSPDPANPHLAVTPLSDRLAAQAQSGKNTMILSFAPAAATTEHPFAQPRTTVTYDNIAAGTAQSLLLTSNTNQENGGPAQSTIVLGSDPYDSVSPLDVLRGVLVLRKLLALNAGDPLTLKNFHVGRQVIMPTEEDIRDATHVIDRDTARLFYEVIEYYPAFEREFNRRTREALRAMSLVQSQ
jgi:general secretion pathway protein D